MARPAFKSEKRKKEVQRLKKQEEKRQKRFNKAAGQSGSETEVILDADGNVVEPTAADTVEAPETETSEKPAAPAQ